MTPEGKVKSAIRKVLKAYGAKVYSHWPVPGGYGASTLDVVACVAGRFLAVEAKAPGKKPTDRQERMIEDIRRAGGVVFVIDGDTSELESWLRNGLE